MPCHPLLEHTEQEIRLMYDINVLAHFWVSNTSSITDILHVRYTCKYKRNSPDVFGTVRASLFITFHY